MTKREKRLQRMRQNPRNVNYEDLIAILEAFGFSVRASGSGGSHVVARYEAAGKVWRVTLVRPHGRSKHVNQTYVKQIIKTIDEIVEMTERPETQDGEENDK